MARGFPGTSSNNLSRAVFQTVGSDWTMAIWTKYDATNGANSFPLFYNGDTALNGYGFSFQTASSNTVKMRQGALAWVGSGYGLTVGLWTHLCMTRIASGTWNFYVNGGLHESHSPGNPNSPTGNIWIGGNNTNGGINAKMADAAIWSAGLSANEVLGLAKGGSPAFTRFASLTGYWPLHGLGIAEPDFSSNIRTLSVTGTAPASDNSPALRLRRKAA